MRHSPLAALLAACTGSGPIEDPRGHVLAEVTLGTGPEDRGTWSQVVAAGMELQSHQPQEDAGRSLSFSNPAVDLCATTTREGLRFEGLEAPDTWRLHVWTTAVGRASKTLDPSRGEWRIGECSGAGSDVMGACLRRIERELADGVTEWWMSAPDGIRQGWVFERAPRGFGDLHVDVALEGLDVSVGPQGRSARLSGGGVSLLYDDLHAWDDLGRSLPAHLEASNGGVRLVVDVQGAQWPVTVDPLMSTPGWSYVQQHSRVHFGSSVAGAGDVDGDGYDDLLVGTRGPGGHPGRDHAYVFLGSAVGPREHAAWTVSTSHEVAGTFAVAGAGDVNGDGLADVVLGYGLRGRVDVFLGASTGLRASPDWRVDGGYSFGAVVAGAGDVNGDGYDDVVVGEPQVASGDWSGSRAYLYLGGPQGLEDAPAWTVANDRLQVSRVGSSLAGAGDVNGDGYDDVLVGATRYGGQDGRVELYRGTPSGLEQTPAWTVGGVDGSGLGTAIAGVGDVNRDGYADVVVGEHVAGEAWLYLGGPAGLSSTPSWRGENEQVHDGFGETARFGAAVSGAGDVNADGYADVLVGAPGFTPTGTTVVGQGLGVLFLGGPQGLQPASAWSATSDRIRASFGSTVARAGDVNGDGYDDVAIAAEGFFGGAVHVYNGQSTLSAAVGDSPAGDEGRPILLDGTASSGMVSWRWDCTDDGSYDVHGAQAACVYPDDGVYTVRLQVGNAAGDVAETTSVSTVANVAPVITGFPDVTGRPNRPVPLVVRATDVDPVTIAIDCGDGAGWQPAVDGAHTCWYAGSGLFAARARVSDDDGGITTVEARVTVEPHEAIARYCGSAPVSGVWALGLLALCRRRPVRSASGSSQRNRGNTSRRTQPR